MLQNVLGIQYKDPPHTYLLTDEKKIELYNKQKKKCTAVRSVLLSVLLSYVQYTFRFVFVLPTTMTIFEIRGIRQLSVP